MIGAAVKISDGFCRKSENRLGTKNAWAQYVRRRWPNNTICEMQRAWPRLTEGQARGILYAQASQSGIDAVLDSLSAVEALELHLEIGCIRLNIKLEDYIQHKAEEARFEKAQWEARERRLQVLSAHVSERRSWPGGDDLPDGSSGSRHAPVGAGEAPGALGAAIPQGERK